MADTNSGRNQGLARREVLRAVGKAAVAAPVIVTLSGIPAYAQAVSCVASLIAESSSSDFGARLTVTAQGGGTCTVNAEILAFTAPPAGELRLLSVTLSSGQVLDLNIDLSPSQHEISCVPGVAIGIDSDQRLVLTAGAGGTGAGVITAPIRPPMIPTQSIVVCP